MLSRAQLNNSETTIFFLSPDEAARYLETFKVYENKPPDALLGQSEGDHFSKVMKENHL